MITKESTLLIPISRVNSHVSHVSHVVSHVVNEQVNKETLNTDIEQYTEQETPYQIINETRENTEEIKEQLNKQDQRIEYIGKAVYTILQKIENKPKVKRNTLPLRQPASNSIYYYLMEQKLEPKFRITGSSSFRLLIIIIPAIIPEIATTAIITPIVRDFLISLILLTFFIDLAFSEVNLLTF